MQKLKHTYKSVLTILIVITLFSCESNYNNIKKLSVSDGAPIAEGKDINFKYTDSGKLVTNLLTPQLLDYSNLAFPYKEFPQGIEVRFWDKKGEKNTVTSKYAIQYENTGLIDLRDSVVLITSDSVILKANQLYWDQKNKWVFTDEPYQIKFKDGSFNNGAVGFDSNQDFTVFLSRKNQGVQLIDKKEIEDGK